MTEKIKITDIKPATYNPRYIDDIEFNELKKSINEFGFVDPIIINLNNNVIIGGHQRYDVLMEEYINEDKYKELNIIKLGEIGWVFPTDDIIFNKDNYLKLNLALNKISGEWDKDKLNLLLSELELNNFDINLTGFEVNLNNEDIEEDDEILELFDDNIDSIDNEELSYDSIILNNDDISYEIIFENLEEKEIWYNFIERIKNNDDKLLSKKIIKVFDKYVQTD